MSGAGTDSNDSALRRMDKAEIKPPRKQMKGAEFHINQTRTEQTHSNKSIAIELHVARNARMRKGRVLAKFFSLDFLGQ
jgi:hypothetical protein